MATNPVKELIDKLQISMRAFAKITGRTQTTVWRHYHGYARIDIDSQDAYEKVGIKIRDMREWNKELAQRGAHDEHSTNSSTQRRDSGSDSV